MPLSPPAGKNYQSPLVSVPSRILSDPLEGPRQVSLEFDWTTMGQQYATLPGGFGSSGGYSIYVNLQNNATINFSQIVSVSIDNSQCGSIVQLIFQDTGEVITVDAFAPRSITPVFSGATQFYAVAFGATSNDVTRVQLLNFVPPPVALPETPSQIASASINTALTTNTNTGAIILPTTVTGTLNNLTINLSVGTPPAAVAELTIGVYDGQARFLITAQSLYIGTTYPVSSNPIVQFENIDWRFSQGLNLSIVTDANWPATKSTLATFVTYTTP